MASRSPRQAGKAPFADVGAAPKSDASPLPGAAVLAISWGMRLGASIIVVWLATACSSVPTIRPLPVAAPSAPSAAPPGIQPGHESAPHKAAFACESYDDACWQRSLADDPFDQARAWSLLQLAAQRERPTQVAFSVSNWLDYRTQECRPYLVPKLQFACDAGLATACRQLFERKGCLRELYERYDGSFSSTAFQPGRFAFLNRDVPLRSGKAELGRVKRGAKVIVLGSKRDKVAVFVIEERLSWYDQLRDAGVDDRLVLSVDEAALSRSAVETLPASTDTKSATNYARIVTTTLEQARTVAEAGEDHDDEALYAWATTPCAPVDIIEERVEGGKKLQRVRQEFAGVVLEGWLAEPVLRSWGPARCLRRSVTVAEAALGKTGREYEPIEDEATAKAVRKWNNSRGKLTLVEFDEQDGPRCVTYDFVRGTLRGSWQQPQPGETRRWRKADSFYAEGRLVDIHEGGEYDDGGEGPVLRCHDTWEVVRVTDTALEVMPSGEPRVLRHSYHPDDVTRWFLNTDACEAALNTRPNYSLDDPRSRNVSSRMAGLNVGTIGC